MNYGLEDCIGARLRKLSRVVDGKFRTALKGTDITENQMTLLFFLEKMGEVDQGVLGKKLILERSSISRNINVLHKKGFVNKTEDYRPQIFLSPRGKTLVQSIIPLWEKVMEELNNSLGNDNIQNLQAMEKALT